MASAQDRDEQLLSIGAQCSAPSCLLVDFLPFNCQHCKQRFCGEHFRVDAHKCDKYDETKFNRVAPSCPFCNEPVAVPLNQDPNISMERHITTKCSFMTGKGKTKSSPVCAKGKCGKVLFAPIRCDKCKQQYCPQHRFPQDHTCVTVQVAPLATSSNPPAAPRATADANKRTFMKTKSPSMPVAPREPAVASPPKLKLSMTSPTEAATNIFSKSNRRAKAERESKQKAMQQRAKKGLLSEEEKKILESKPASPKSKKGGDCILM